MAEPESYQDSDILNNQLGDSEGHQESDVFNDQLGESEESQENSDSVSNQPWNSESYQESDILDSQNQQWNSEGYQESDTISNRVWNSATQPDYCAPSPSSGSNSEVEENYNYNDNEHEHEHEHNVSEYYGNGEGEEEDKTETDLNTEQEQEQEQEFNQSQDEDEQFEREDCEGEWTYEMAEMKEAPDEDWQPGTECGVYSFSQEEDHIGDQGGRTWSDTKPTKDFKKQNISQDNENDTESGTKTFKIFVSNLPPRIQKSELLELFEKYGEVVECENFAKNYAFVHMTSEESGNKALLELNGYEIQGCKINVKRSHHSGRSLLQEKKDSAMELEVGTYKLYVGHLPKDTTKEFVRQLVEEYGRVVEVEIYRGTAAFVHMETKEGGLKAIKGLNGKLIPDSESPLTVSESKNLEGPSLTTTKLKVSSVPVSVTADELRNLFLPYGLVLGVKIFKRVEASTKGRNAIVYLEQYGNIRSAIKDLSETIINGQEIKVEAFFGQENELAGTATKHKSNQQAGNFRNPRVNDPDPFGGPFPVLRKPPPVPMHNVRGSGMRLVPMPSQDDIWGTPQPVPVPQPSGMRLIPMPSQEELYRFPSFGSGRGRPPSLFNMDSNPFLETNQDNFCYDDSFSDSYPNYDNEYYNQHHHQNYGPPPRKVSKNMWNKASNSKPPGAGGFGNANSNASLRQRKGLFPELPSTEEFPRVPKSLMTMQIPSLNDSDYSADLSLSTFSDFSTSNDNHDYTSDDPLPGSTLNAVPFDYSQMGNRKQRHQNGKHVQKQQKTYTHTVTGKGGKAYINSKGVLMFRGERGGKKAKGKSRRPGLGTNEQQKKFANQSGGVDAANVGVATSSSPNSIPVTKPPSNPTPLMSLATASMPSSSSSSSFVQQNYPIQEALPIPTIQQSSSSSSVPAPSYFQQNWNFKNKRSGPRRPTAREIREAEEEQKRQYADYLKQKPWLYQAIPGTVKKVQK